MIPFPCRAVSKLNNEWIIGWYARIHNTHLFYIVPENTAMLCSREILPETICFCTGQYDQGGDLIYVNDIVYDHFDNELCVVEWDEADSRFILRSQGTHEGFDVVDSADLQVVGNIFDDSTLVAWYK